MDALSTAGYVSDGKTYYRYTYCTLITSYKVYRYYMWDAWSDWSYTPVEGSDDVEVETKIAGSISISFDANGGTGAPPSTAKDFDETITLSTIIPTRENYQFFGWATTSQGEAEYIPGGEYSANKSVTFYAVWNDSNNYTIFYNANGGTGAPPQQSKVHGEAEKINLIIPKREGYDFVGWPTSRDGIIDYFWGDEYNDNKTIILYALWITHYHQWDSGTITKRPTHTTYGERTYKCETCSVERKEQIDKTTEHSYSYWEMIDETYHKRTCICGITQTSYHNWNSSTITLQPTHISYGECTYTCQDCSTTKKEQIAKTITHSYGA